MSFDVFNPRELGDPRGWNNGMLARPGARILFVAGQDASEPGGTVRPGLDFVEQFERVLRKVLAVVREAGGGAEDIGRLTIFVTDIEGYRESRAALGEAYRGLMGKHYPAMALVEVASLVDRNAVVEIEATAALG